MDDSRASNLGVTESMSGATVAGEVAGEPSQARAAGVPKNLGSGGAWERLLSLTSPLLLLLLWELLVRAHVLDSRFFPAPTHIVGTFVSLIKSGELLIDLKDSLARAIVGFIMGAIPGLILGILMGLSSFIRAFMKPIVASLYTIPKIAILPMIMLIFGLGEMSKYVTIAIAVVFIIVINTMAGVMEIDSIYLDVGKNFGASRLQFYWTVALPGALPSIFAGVQLAAGVSLLVLVASEFVGAKTGVGYLIWQSWQTFSIEAMYCGLVVLSFLGFLTQILLDMVRRWIIPWKTAV